MTKLPAILFLCMCCAAAAAQNMYTKDGEDPKRFSGGLVAGVNLSQVDGDSYYGFHKVGLHAGGMVYVHFSPVFGVSMELLYSEKGSRGETITGSAAVGTYVSKYFMNVNYVEVPVTLHAILAGTDMEVGASYARLIKSSEWILTDQPVAIDPELNRFNNTDVDFIVGATRQLYKQIYINVRYEYSLISIRPPERIPVGYGYGAQGQFNNLFNVRFVYML